MTEKLLSIIILTIPQRKQQLDNLINQINSGLTIEDAQYVETIIVGDNPDQPRKTIGEKRNIGNLTAKGKFVWHVDDDDQINPKALKSLIQACKNDVDCIGIKCYVYINGIYSGISDQSLDYENDFNTLQDNNIKYRRIPNTRNPILREHALKINMLDVDFGEDADFGKRIKSFLKSQIKLEEPIYYYYSIDNKYIFDKTMKIAKIVK